MTRQDLAEREAADLPSARLRGAVLERTAHAGLAHRALPALTARATLVAEAAQILALLAGQIAEARDVEARRPVAEVILAVQHLVHEKAFGAGTEVMVHQIVTELA